MIHKGRCGTCEKFPGNGKKCDDCTISTRIKVYANDYGNGSCGNYEQ